ncbi:MAG: HD domain-containing protein [Bacteroidia bacterium]
MPKAKIYNDPVYGFITIPFQLINDLIEHPYFQRLRRIKQLGLTHYVYPGALHTRFHHALGAMYLMMEAVETLRSKGIEINHSEAEAVTVAILLHDIGHGPFSHALENSIVTDVHHETISVLFMNELNEQMNGRLKMAIEIFQNQYPKKFLHQLVSSQLDMDRLDYLNRDSFFTGVSEGVVSSDRIIKMLDVHDDNLVVEQKGIYSIEKFIISRRLMYWQVYLHKTVLAAENLLMKILQRAKELAEKGADLFATPAFLFFLQNTITESDFASDKKVLHQFALLDDYDVFTSVKVWCYHPDFILSTLCTNLIDRKLYKIKIQKERIDSKELADAQQKAVSLFNIEKQHAHYFAFEGEVVNNAYKISDEKINILFKDDSVTDIAFASDNLNIHVLSEPIVKHYLCVDRKLLQKM